MSFDKITKFQKLNKQYNNEQNSKNCMFIDKSINPMYSNNPEFIKIKLKNYYDKSKIPKEMPFKQYVKLPIIELNRLKEDKFNKIMRERKNNSLNINSTTTLSNFDNKKLDYNNQENSKIQAVSQQKILESAFKHKSSPKKKLLIFENNPIEDKQATNLAINTPNQSYGYSRKASFIDSPLKRKNTKKYSSKNLNDEPRFNIAYYNKNTINILEPNIKTTKQSRDNVIIKYNLLVIPNFNMFSIISGFGKSAVEISQTAKFNILNYFNDHNNYLKDIPQIERMKHFNDTKSLLSLLKENNFTPFINFSNQCLKDMKKLSKLDTLTSGAIACSCIMIDDIMYILNIGDSRAMVIENEKSKFLNTIHNTNREEERKRILSHKNATIERNHKTDFDEFTLRYSDKPTQRVTRCIGSTFSYELGALNTPDLIEYTITDSTQALIIGTNQFWISVDEGEVEDIIYKYINYKPIEKSERDNSHNASSINITNSNMAAKELVETSLAAMLRVNNNFNEASVIVIYFTNKSI